MVFQPTNRGEETVVFSGLLSDVKMPDVKNTFLHYDVHAGATAVVEQQELRRHQTAPVASTVDSDSEEENVELPPKIGSGPALLRELKAHIVAPPPMTKEDCPVPGALCRHTTHDAFDDGQVWDSAYYAPGNLITEGHNFNENDMTGMQVLPEGLQWDGQMGGQCGVLPMTSSTVMFVGVHPPVWMPEDAANYGQVPMIPLMAQPQTLHLPIDAMEQDQPGDWQNWSPEYYDGQLQVPQQVSNVSQNPEAFESLQSMVLGQPGGAAIDFQPTPPIQQEKSFWDGVSVELLHQPQKIGRSANMDHVQWVVDASKLNDKAKVLVSPEFKIPGRNGHQFSFKMVMYPKDKTSFRAAGGQGFVQLKCESDTQDLDSCLLSFRMGICNGYIGADAKREGPRGAVTWDFKKSLVCDDEEVKKTWNFKDVVDPKTRTFAVCIEILSMEA